MKKFYIKTFGCQMNVHDSERMAGILLEEAYQPTEDPKNADVIVLNTCSIRQKAEQKFFSSLGRLKHLKRRNPGLKIVVAGCIAQQEGKKIFKRASYVDHVIGPQNIHRILDTLTEDKPLLVEENPDIASEEMPAQRDSTVRAWVNIMYGCNNFCSYCVVPYTRGREVSRPSGKILDEIQGLVDQGYREVRLLGQNVNSYTSDVDFPGLLTRINGIQGLERIRFVTSHSRDFTEKLMHAMRDLDKVCESIHLPVQSGSDRILKLMNRGYTAEDYHEKVRLLRETIPDIAITTDIIAGFPSETDEDHEATLALLREVEYDGIFAFKFSPRPMTTAAGMDDQVEDTVGSRRLIEILNLQDAITLRKNKTLEGRAVEVLVDSTTEEGQLSGRTRTNKIVTVKNNKSMSYGSIIQVKIKEAHKHSLAGIFIR